MADETPRRSHGQADPLLMPTDFARNLAPDALTPFDLSNILDPSNLLDTIDDLITEGVLDPLAEAFAANNDFAANRFGRMFRPQRPPFRPTPESLIELGTAMEDPDNKPTGQPEPSAGDSDIPAGFTYFAQFVDHDLTLDPTRGFPDAVDPETLRTPRTPTLDLDSLYGLGPRANATPQFYDPAFRPREARFKLGTTTPIPSSIPGGPLGSFPNDLPRKGGTGSDRKQAVIAEPRNDENLVIAQLTLAFMKLHNKLIQSPPRGNPGETPFETVRRLVRWHYQWIVLHDYLPRVIRQSAIDDVLKNGRKFYNFRRAPFNGKPFMPVEFSVAAYRMGHSMVRNTYSYNRIFTGGGPGGSATLEQLFLFTGERGLAGADTLPSNWIIDWRRFFEVGGFGTPFPFVTRKIDSRLAFSLRDVPTVVPPEPTALAVRNLLRGRLIGLPTGQFVADAMKNVVQQPPLTREELASGPEADVVRKHGFDRESPLWFYLLREAIVRAGENDRAPGNQLGPVGSRIVAEVIIGVLQGDRRSYLSAEPDWKPTLPAATPGTFTMADLLRFVGDLNPLGT